eukprot:1142328-Pelagomonas_calceolata.AAC.1
MTGICSRGGCCWSCCRDWACCRGGCAVALRFKGVAGTAPALGGTFDTVGACAAGLVATVCVGGGAGSAAAADGGGMM